jgi:hypothetical protein
MSRNITMSPLIYILWDIERNSFLGIIYRFVLNKPGQCGGGNMKRNEKNIDFSKFIKKYKEKFGR